MDKQNALIGFGLLILAFGFYIWSSQQMVEQQRERAEQATQSEPAEVDSTEPISTDIIPAFDGIPLETGTLASEATEIDSIPEVAAPAALALEAERPATMRLRAEASTETLILENEFMQVEFNAAAASIRAVRFTQTGPDNGIDPYVFNAGASRPALAMAWEGSGGLQPYAPRFEIMRQTEDTVVFVHRGSDGINIFRIYEIATPELEEGEEKWRRQPYAIRHETHIENTRESPLNLPRLALSVGTALPIPGNRMHGDDMYLALGHYNGRKADFFKARQFSASGGFFGLGSRAARPSISEEHQPLVWGAVKNQFFVAVMNERLAAGQIGFANKIYGLPATAPAIEDGDQALSGVTGFVGFDLPVIASGDTVELVTEYYVGPKEYVRLDQLGERQHKLMQYGVFEIISVPLLLFMKGIHWAVPNWGLAILIMTLIIRSVLWPITAQAAKSQKRMAKISEPMKELRAKYKDNPQKIQQETMRLFKEHKVNPAAGCLPMVMQLPILLGLFWMLRTASELRFAEFLWVSDLSQADTVATIAGFPINILPVTMAVTMYLQMRMMPMNPAADETQQTVQKMFRFMPAVMLVFLYNFAAGLTLYWTMSNCVTILQQYLTNKNRDEELEAPKAETFDRQAPKPKKKAAQALPQNEQDILKKQRRASTKGAHGKGKKKR